MKKIVAVYLRVSTTDQDCALQRAELKFRISEFEEMGFEIQFFEDKFTGKTLKRPEWSKVDALLKAGQLHAILVWRLDRLGRTASGLTALFDELRARMVNLVSQRDGIDLSTPAGRMLAGVLASVAQYETEVRCERQIAGIAAAKAEGKKLGGSKKGRVTRRVAQKKASIVALFLDGHSKLSIAKSLEVNRETVGKVISDYVAATNREKREVAAAQRSLERLRIAEGEVDPESAELLQS